MVFDFGGASALGARPSPTDTIRDANTTVRTLLKQPGTDAKVTHELRDLFDIGDLAKRALVDHWKDMSEKQRNDLVETLRQVVEKNYVAQLRSNLDYEIVYVGEEPHGEDVVVKTVIKAQKKGRPVEIPVDYTLRADGDHWRAYDVITDEVSILDNYRSQFNRIIAKDGIDGLIRRMKTRLEKGDE
jgi:phospholipid transport system substrate-binding protein